MFSLVNIGQVAKFPLLMARMRVDVDGLKHAMRRNFIVSAMVPAGTMLLARLVVSWLVVGWCASNLTRHSTVWWTQYPVRMVLVLS